MNWYGYSILTTILKLGWDFGPGAGGDAVGAFKLVDLFVVGIVVITNGV